MRCTYRTRLRLVSLWASNTWEQRLLFHYTAKMVYVVARGNCLVVCICRTSRWSSWCSWWTVNWIRRPRGVNLWDYGISHRWLSLIVKWRDVTSITLPPKQIELMITRSVCVQPEVNNYRLTRDVYPPIGNGAVPLTLAQRFAIIIMNKYK